MLFINTIFFRLWVVNVYSVDEDAAGPGLDLLLPLVDDSTWTNNQNGTMAALQTIFLSDLSGGLKASYQSNSWKSFAQTHFISENSASIIQIWLQKPLKCNDLMFH